MDDWNEVKAKPKKKSKKPQGEQKRDYGGKGANGKLIAGPIKKNLNTNNDFGYSNNDYVTFDNQASAIADFDYHIDSDEEVKYETVSHQCAQAVSEARLKAGMT